MSGDVNVNGKKGNNTRRSVDTDDIITEVTKK